MKSSKYLKSLFNIFILNSLENRNMCTFFLQVTLYLCKNSSYMKPLKQYIDKLKRKIQKFHGTQYKKGGNLQMNNKMLNKKFQMFKKCINPINSQY